MSKVMSQGNFSGCIQTGRSRLCKSGAALGSLTRRGSGSRPGDPLGLAASGSCSAGVCRRRPDFRGRAASGSNFVRRLGTQNAG